MKPFRTLYADEIDVRVAQINTKGCSLLLYKNARVDMDLLDETVGAMNWKRQHSRENANCTVSIYDPDKGEWISKEDTGTESNTEAEKGLASDSFKRACVNWGIGRELYTAPFIWVKAGDVEIEDGYGNKKKTNDKFSVHQIEYDQSRRISKLVIYNEKKRKTVFDWTICSFCKKPITDVIGKDGQVIPADEVARISMNKSGKTLCSECFASWRKVQRNAGVDV